MFYFSLRRLSLNSLEKIGSLERKKMKVVRKQEKVVRRKPEVKKGKAKKKRRESTASFARRTNFIYWGVSVARRKIYLEERCEDWWNEYLERITGEEEGIQVNRARNWADLFSDEEDHGIWKCKWRKTWWKNYVKEGDSEGENSEKDSESEYDGSEEEEEQENLVCVKSDMKYERIWKLGGKPVRKYMLKNPMYLSEKEKNERELAMRAEFGVKTTSDGVLYNGEWYKGVKWRDEIKVVVEKYEGE